MPKFVDWSHDLSVGAKEIDEQHMKLIDLVNEMHEAITEGIADLDEFLGAAFPGVVFSIGPD